MCYIYSIYPWIKCFIYILQIRKPNQDFKKVSQVIISQTAVQVGTQNHLTSACALKSLPKGDEFITSGECLSVQRIIKLFSPTNKELRSKRKRKWSSWKLSSGQMVTYWQDKPQLHWEPMAKIYWASVCVLHSFIKYVLRPTLHQALF